MASPRRVRWARRLASALFEWSERVEIRKGLRPAPSQPLAGAAFDFVNDPYLFTLFNADAFQRALGGVSERLTREQVDYMMDMVGRQNHSEAQRAQVAAMIFEDLESIFRRFAGEYRPALTERKAS